MARKGFWAEEVDEGLARRIANIIGNNSAFGRALDELATRRSAGEDVAIVKAGTRVLVVPRAEISNVTQMPARTNQ